jgi:DNA-binding GntR family transcriptional regulator
VAVEGRQGIPPSALRGGPHRTLAERAFNELRAAIVSGELPPGTRLRIHELADSLDMSPMPIREAVRRLEALGLVEHVPHRGARVTVQAPQDLLDLVRARLAVEPAATSLAASGFEDTDRTAAERALAQYRLAAELKDIGAVCEADHDFHFALYQAAGSPWLLRLIRPLWESAERYRRTGAHGAYALSERETEHSIILEACVRHDESAAAESMSRHLKRSANRISAALMGTTLFSEVA